MKKTDTILSLITGEGVAWLFILMARAAGREIGLLTWVLPVFLPLLALFCLWVSYLLGKKYLFIFQLAKFLLIGVFFALFDLAILNSLMAYFGITKGKGYLFFVSISFVIVTAVKYIADKYWAFEKREKTKMGVEFSRFFIITLVSWGIQVGIASLVVNSIGVQFGLPALVWANIGKILGVAVASIWNFIGYKFIVFKK